MKNKTLIASILSLFLGLVIYLLFRTSSLKIFNWLNYFNIDFLNSSIRLNAFTYSKLVPQWILFSLPDGLWTFSYVCLMLYIWNFKISLQSIIWITLIPFIAVFSEIGQAFNLIQGTFDYLDLFFYILGMVLPLAYLFIKNLKSTYNEQKT